ncbi:tissue factor pathway inhibitor 2-like [Clytia hemisphaerica]|uniref:Uncharacterized protein n=1 Tax=Clytia hemisphaerica TaxID=252671 RepID=A0A7M5WLU2_9CNID
MKLGLLALFRLVLPALVLCLSETYETVEALVIPGCPSNSGRYGCCVDGITPAQGPNQQGCPEYKSECDMPAVTGGGNDRLIRYYYNPSKKECESFAYSGKGGNRNNFISQQACERRCSENSDSVSIECRDVINTCDEFKRKGYCSRRIVSSTYCRKTCKTCT